jgi:uncharacterized protein YcgI (DUF1989 family)
VDSPQAYGGRHEHRLKGKAVLGLAAGLAKTPAPLNLFMNIPVIDGNRVEMQPPVSTPGSYVTLRAEMNCIVAFPPARRICCRSMVSQCSRPGRISKCSISATRSP